MTGRTKREPVGEPGDDLNAVTPIVSLKGGARHRCDVGVVVGAGEAGKYVGADRRHDVGLRRLGCEHDGPHRRAHLLHLGGKRQIFLDWRHGIGHDNVYGSFADPSDRLCTAATDLQLVSPKVEHRAERGHEWRVGPNCENSSHGQHPVLSNGMPDAKPVYSRK